jgi:polyhydroxybutyrate depolymerase
MKSLLPLLLTLLTLACHTPTSVRADDSGTETFTFKTGGHERSYEVYRPASARGNDKRPLVVALHGGFGTGEIMAEQSRFNAVADRAGFIVAYPDGIARAWNAGRCCAKPMKEKVDDVGFIKAMITRIAADYPIDRSQVFGTGFSNGAMMVHRIACEAPEVFAAIAPVSGGVMLERCDSGRGIPTLMIQGKLDKRIPWDGGTVEDSYRPSMSALVEMLGKRNGCGAQAKQLQKRGQLACYRQEGCKAALEWCGLDEVGHQWPGGKTLMARFLGPNTQAFDASQGIWAFFAAQR